MNAACRNRMYHIIQENSRRIGVLNALFPAPPCATPSRFPAREAARRAPPASAPLGVGVQGKPVDAGTAGTAQERALTLVAKPRADAPDLLASPLPKSNALLYRSRQGPGQLGGVVAQGVIAGGRRCAEARLQVSQPPQRTDDPPADRLDHRGDVGIAGRRNCP